MRETKYYSCCSIAMRRVCLIYCIIFRWIFISPVKHLIVVNTIKDPCEQKYFSHFTHNSVMFSVLLHGSDQKVWQSLLVKSLQKKKSNNQEKLNLYNDSDKQHAIKSAFFFADAANATTSGGGRQRLSDS